MDIKRQAEKAIKGSPKSIQNILLGCLDRIKVLEYELCSTKLRLELRKEVIMSTKITVTITDCVQVGIDSFKDKRYSRVYCTSMSIDTILNWAKSVGIKNPTINDLEFSDYTGSST